MFSCKIEPGTYYVLLGREEGQMERQWMMKQNWHDTFFLHWPVSEEWLRSRIPEELQLDTFDGKAWIGVVGFRASGTRPRFSPPVPGTVGFLELNVRTYVTCNGKSGVFFFSLDANSPLAVEAASTGGFLPYRHAKLDSGKRGDVRHFRSRLRDKEQPPETLDVSYRISPEPIPSDAFGQWLTERYCLWTKPGKHLLRVDIWHIPWELHLMKGEIRRNTMAAFLPADLHGMQPVSHYGGFQEVLFYPPVREDVRRRRS